MTCVPRAISMGPSAAVIRRSPKLTARKQGGSTRSGASWKRGRAKSACTPWWVDPSSGTSHPHWSATTRSSMAPRTIRRTSSSKKNSGWKLGLSNGMGT